MKVESKGKVKSGKSSSSPERRQFRHYLRENKSGALPRRLLFIDSETKERDTSGEARHYAYLSWTCFMELRAHNKKGYTEIWRKWVEMPIMWNYIESLTAQKMILYIVASNVTFDLFATGGAEHLTKSGWTMRFYHQAATQLILKLTKGKRSIVFLNLQNFWPVSIAKLGEYLELPKFEIDFDKSSPQAIEMYCKRDVEILKQGFLTWLSFIKKEDLGRWGFTYASQAFNAFRHRFMSDKILPLGDSEEDKFCRQGYFGGRVECFWIGKQKQGDFYMVDVNSMYPYVMRDNPFPSVLQGQASDVPLDRLRSLLSEYCLVGAAIIETDEPVYPIRDKDKMIFPVGRFTTVLGTEGIRYALNHSHLISVSHLYIFHRARLFTKWVEGMYNKKQEAKQRKDVVAEKIYKLLLNSLYGKFGQMSPTVVYDEYTPDNDFSSQRVFYDDQPGQGMEYKMFHRHVQTKGRHASKRSNVAIALHVTEDARFVLWGYIQTAGIENVFYCDTDSLIISEPGYRRLFTHIQPLELGKLSLERKGDRLTINAPKDYSLGAYKKQKGIRKDAVECSPGVFRQTFFPGFKTLLARGIQSGFPIETREKKLTYNYTKGIVGPDGRVTPLKHASAALSLPL